MAGEALEIPIQATGGDAAATEIGKATRAVDTFSQHSKTAAASSATLAANTQKLSAGLGAFGGALGQIDPLLGQFGASVGRAGGAIGAMTSLIGGGPGVLFGGAVAVIGLLSSAFSASAREAELAAKATDTYAGSINRLIAARRAMREEESLVGLLNAGGGTAEQRQGARDALAEKLRGLERGTPEWDHNYRQWQQMGAPVYGAGEEVTIETGAMLRPGDAGYDQAMRDAGFGDRLRTPGRGGGGRGAANDNARMDARLAQALGEGTGGRSSNDDVFNLMAGGGLNRSPGSDQTGFDDFISSSASRGLGGGGRGSIALGGKGGSGGQVKESVRQAEEVKAAWTDAGAAITDSFAGVFAALITGGEVSAKAMLAALGNQMVGEGSRAVFSGLLQTALGNPLGPTMIGIGAAEIAFAAGLGATLGGAQGGSGGGAARPSPGGNGGRGERDQGPTIINVYALNPNAEAGKAMAKAERMRSQRRLAS